MMFKFLIFFLLLLVAIGLGWVIHQDSGFVLISFSHWEIETSVWMALLLLLGFFLILYFVLRLIARTRIRPRQWRLIEAGAGDLIEEKWQNAEQHFIQAAQNRSRTFLEYTGAAIAAQAQNAYDRRDLYLRQAFQTSPQAEIPLGLLLAKLQIQAQQWPEATATLKKLQNTVPYHPLLKKLEVQVSKNKISIEP